MRLYKTVKGYIKFMTHLARWQEVGMLKGFDKLPPQAQKMLYELIAGIQNDIRDYERIIEELR